MCHKVDAIYRSKPPAIETTKRKLQRDLINSRYRLFDRVWTSFETFILPIFFPYIFSNHMCNQEHTNQKQTIHFIVIRSTPFLIIMAAKKRHEIRNGDLRFVDRWLIPSCLESWFKIAGELLAHSVNQVRLVLHYFCMFENVVAEAEERAPRSYRHLAAKFETWFNFSKTKLKSFSFSNVPYDTDDCSPSDIFCFILSRQEFYRCITSTQVKGGEKACVMVAEDVTGVKKSWRSSSVLRKS